MRGRVGYDGHTKKLRPLTRMMSGNGAVVRVIVPRLIARFSSEAFPVDAVGTPLGFVVPPDRHITPPVLVTGGTWRGDRLRR